MPNCAVKWGQSWVQRKNSAWPGSPCPPQHPLEDSPGLLAPPALLRPPLPLAWHHSTSQQPTALHPDHTRSSGTILRESAPALWVPPSPAGGFPARPQSPPQCGCPASILAPAALSSHLLLPRRGAHLLTLHPLNLSPPLTRGFWPPPGPATPTPHALCPSCPHTPAGTPTWTLAHSHTTSRLPPRTPPPSQSKPHQDKGTIMCPYVPVLCPRPISLSLSCAPVPVLCPCPCPVSCSLPVLGQQPRVPPWDLGSAQPAGDREDPEQEPEAM